MLGCSCWENWGLDNMMIKFAIPHSPNRVLHAVRLIRDPVAFGATARWHERRRTQNGLVRVEVVQVAPIGGTFDPATCLLIES